MAKTRRTAGGMNKRRLAEALAGRMGVSQAMAEEAVENVFDICANEAAQGNSISISNFGTFECVTRPSRFARNPQTGDRTSIPERKAVRFVVSPRLNLYANSDSPEEATIRKRPRGRAKQ